MELLEGEKIDFEKGRIASNVGLSDEDINKKYVRGDIRIVTEQARYPLPTIVTMLDSGNYELNPEFQRRHRWSLEKRSRLIESFIMNVPIPPVFLYETEYSSYEVMDGLQRLTAIAEYYRGNYALAGLREWRELDGRKYDALPEQIKRGIDRRYLSSIILLQETAKSDSQAQELKQLVFERINSGGDKLEAQESRNALYNGPLNKLCIELADDRHFRMMWGIPTPETYAEVAQEELPLDEGDTDVAADFETALVQNPRYRKMQDVELVLRFFAYRQITDVEQGRLSDFLDEFLKQGNLFRRELLEAYRELFTRTCRVAYGMLGKRAFYMYRRRTGDMWGWFERPTKLVYDPLMHAISHRLDRENDLLDAAPSWLEWLESFYEDHYEDFAGRSTNRSDIVVRRELMLGFLDAKLG